MSWEVRQKQKYYYRVRRDQEGRLVKTYVGTGAAAERAVAEDQRRQNERERQQERRRAEKQRLQTLDNQLTDLTKVTKTLVKAILYGVGYHEHKRQWRKRRHAISLHQEGNETMENHTLNIESASFDVLEDLVHQAQAGDATTLPVIRHLLDQVPELWEDSRVLAHQVEQSWIRAVSGQDILSQEVIEREVHTLRRQLLGTNPSPLETLLVDRICSCWLAVMHAELLSSKRLNPQNFVLSTTEENRLDKVNRRFLTAVRELARVRKLLTPEAKFQVNIGAQQIVA
jgi:hypothetical protein